MLVYGTSFSIKACPHLFPKQETLYPETGDFGAEQSRLLHKFAVSDNEVSWNGNKIACFR